MGESTEPAQQSTAELQNGSHLEAQPCTYCGQVIYANASAWVHYLDCMPGPLMRKSEITQEDVNEFIRRCEAYRRDRLNEVEPVERMNDEC